MNRTLPFTKKNGVFTRKLLRTDSIFDMIGTYRTNGFAEISAIDLEEIDGGVWWETALAMWSVYEIGYAIGKGIAHITS